MKKSTMIENVRAHLVASKGKLRLISRITGIGYYTILRLRDGKAETGYLTVEMLDVYFKVKRNVELSSHNEPHKGR